MKKKTIFWIYLSMIIGLVLTFTEGCKKNSPQELPKDYTGQKGTVTDIDGNIYNTIGIGTQIWMAENLKTTKFNDGTDISFVMDSLQHSEPAYFWYNNDSNTNKNTYGALYNAFTVNTGKLAPQGWHIPSENEIYILIYFLGGSMIYNTVGGMMKTTGTIEESTGLWHSPNTGATNSTGFSAIPGGTREGDNGAFMWISYSGLWWTTSHSPGGSPLIFFIDFQSTDISVSATDPRAGCNVRCVKN